MNPSSRDEHRREVVQWRMRWYPRAVIAAAGAVLMTLVLFGSGASTAGGRLGGDYPAFYGAGRIAIEHDWDHLYDPSRQLEAQGDLLPGESIDYYLHFAYPPFVAVAYAPLALLPFRVSYLVHTLLAAAAVAGAIWLAGQTSLIPRRRRLLALALALSFLPLLISVAGGQNTAFTLLLLVASWRLAADRNDIAAGLVLSVLLFKPQYAVPMILLYLLAGRWRVVLGSVVGAGALYMIGASVMGIDWLVPWWNHVWEFAASDATTNGIRSISFIGFATGLSDATQVIVLLGVVPAAATVVLLAYVWLRGRPDALAEKMALAATGLILISPHSMFYDGSLVLITLVVLAVQGSLTSKWVAFLWVAASSQVLAIVLGWAPFFFIVLGIAVWASLTIGRGLFDRAVPPSNVEAG